jgi:hypothetical protein
VTEDSDDRPYQQPGFNADVYINSNGDFRWVPRGTSCQLREGLLQTMKTVKGMPSDRENVWGKRIDSDATKERCPLTRDDPEISKKFDEFVSAYKGPGAT